MIGRAQLRQFIVKIHSRCNLACEYCYVYTMADQRWRERPVVMSTRTIDQTAERVAEQLRERSPPAVEVVLHGGEPLLAGRSVIRYCVDRLRRRLQDLTDTRFTIQTNGTRLDGTFLELLRELEVRVGVSLDGAAGTQDRRRPYHHGGGSHADTVRALRRLARRRYRHLFAGLLATIDVSSDPVTTFDALCAHGPPMIDFLLPHGNWSAPPPGHRPHERDTPYGDWLVTAFDRWYDAPVRETRVRLFEEVMSLLLGGSSRTEAIGAALPSTVIIETDGSIEDSGALNAAYSGAATTGLHVSRDPLAAVFALPEFATRLRGVDGLSATCQACRLRRVCGGGLYAHRYRTDTGCDNPSVYCRDLQRLIDHIRARMEADVSAIRQSARQCAPGGSAPD